VWVPVARSPALTWHGTGSHSVTRLFGSRFGFFLPQLDVSREHSAEFRTVGVYGTSGGPDSIPHRDPSSRCIELHGTAQSVIVPL
jgi:hypothetical protein